PPHDAPVAVIREAEMFRVPILRLLLIRRLEEDTADAEDSSLLAHGCFLSRKLGIIRTMPLRQRPDYFLAASTWTRSDSGAPLTLVNSSLVSLPSGRNLVTLRKPIFVGPILSSKR